MKEMCHARHMPACTHLDIIISQGSHQLTSLRGAIIPLPHYHTHSTKGTVKKKYNFYTDLAMGAAKIPMKFFI